tara:strand:+ start:70 stop:498 length:429 start_codon:yes stop_codon:yes gene_type:complete
MIEYIAPSSGGSALTYPIEQITVNLTNAELKTLNTSPFEILPQGFYYNGINVTLKYNNNLLNPGILLFIGYESLISSSGWMFVFDTSVFNNQFGVYSISAYSNNQARANTLNNEPLVVYQASNDNLANYTLFELTVTYLKFT